MIEFFYFFRAVASVCLFLTFLAFMIMFLTFLFFWILGFVRFFMEGLWGLGFWV